MYSNKIKIRGFQLHPENIRHFEGEKHGKWKGDKVGYHALHDWISRHKKKTGICHYCLSNKEFTEWANVSGKYKRDLNDFIELCRKCHSKKDKKGEKLQNNQYSALLTKNQIRWLLETRPNKNTHELIAYYWGVSVHTIRSYFYRNKSYNEYINK